MSIQNRFDNTWCFAIEKTISEANERFFLPHGIKIELLKNCPQAIGQLADWIFEEWRSYDASLTKEKLISSLAGRLNDDKLPLTLVALKNGAPIGSVSLKDQPEPELQSLSKGNAWLGTLQVASNERNKGVGRELLKVATHIAKQLGHNTLLFYLSNPASVEWCTRRGAVTLQTMPFRGHTVTLMKIPL